MRKHLGKITIGLLLVISLLCNAFQFISTQSRKSASMMYDTSYNAYKGESSYLAAPQSSYNEEISYDSAKGAESTDVMLVKTASIALTLKNNDKVAEEIRTQLTAQNGRVVNANSYQQSEGYQTYQLTVRIPQENYDSFLTYLKGLGEVNNCSENSYDVSTEYQDNALRIEMYENKLVRLYELLNQAENMSDLLTIENSVSDTIYMIESLKGTQSNLEDKSSYSTITITLYPNIPETVQTGGFDNIFIEAFAQSLNSFLLFAQWLIRVLFFLFPYALIGGGIYWTVKRIQVNRKKKQEPVEKNTIE